MPNLNRSTEIMVAIAAMAIVVMAYKVDSRLRESVSVQQETMYQMKAMRHELEAQNPDHPRGGLGEPEDAEEGKMENDLGVEELRANVESATIEDAEWVREAIKETEDRELLADALELVDPDSDLAAHIHERIQRLAQDEMLDGDVKLQARDPEEETVTNVLDGEALPEQLGVEVESADFDPVDDDFEEELEDEIEEIEAEMENNDGQDESDFVSAEELAGN